MVNGTTTFSDFKDMTLVPCETARSASDGSVVKNSAVWFDSIHKVTPFPFDMFGHVDSATSDVAIWISGCYGDGGECRLVAICVYVFVWDVVLLSLRLGRVLCLLLRVCIMLVGHGGVICLIVLICSRFLSLVMVLRMRMWVI